MWQQLNKSNEVYSVANHEREPKKLGPQGGLEFTQKLRATPLFRDDKWMKCEQSALVADPGWKTWWELDERETGKPVLVPGPFRHLEVRRVSIRGSLDYSTLL